MKKNLLIGGVIYGRRNVGDEAILEAMISSFHEAANIDVTTMSSDWIAVKYPEVGRIDIPVIYDKPKLFLTATPRKHIFKAIKYTFFPDMKQYQNRDLMLCGGGTILSDCPWYSMHIVEQAGKCNFPIVLWGVGMAVIDDADTRKRVVDVCSADYVNKIYTRDGYVKERLIGYGVPAQKVDVCYDPAYILDGAIADAEKILSDKAKKLYFDERPNLCVSLSGEPDVTDSEHIEEMRKFILSASEKYNVFLVATGFNEKCRDAEIMKSLEMNEHTVYIDRELSSEELIGFLKKIDLIISSRLHCSIFGANAGTPSINIVRNIKQEDFSMLFGLPSLKFSEVKAERVATLVEEMMAKRNEKSAQMKEKMEEIRKHYKAKVDEIIETYLSTDE